MKMPNDNRPYAIHLKERLVYLAESEVFLQRILAPLRRLLNRPIAGLDNNSSPGNKTRGGIDVCILAQDILVHSDGNEKIKKLCEIAQIEIDDLCLALPENLREELRSRLLSK